MVRRAAEYVPDRGDLIWLMFDPQARREQAGRRPALVLSPKAYNEKVGLALLCPVTSHVKGYPFEVAIPAGRKIGGAVLSDHVKSLDWRIRQAQYADQAPPAVLAEVRRKLQMLI